MTHADAIAALLRYVQTVVNESGAPSGFDTEGWLHCWLREANPALGGRTPSNVLKEPDGFEVVRSILARMQSGAYA